MESNGGGRVKNEGGDKHKEDVQWQRGEGGGAEREMKSKITFGLV